MNPSITAYLAGLIERMRKMTPAERARIIINHQHTVAIRSQIQPLRAMLAGCTSPEQRKSLRGQIAELNRQAVN